MDPLMQALERLQQLVAMPQPVSNMEMIRQLVQAEFKRQESPQVLSYICEAERELFEQHQDKVQAFLESADGCDAWGLLVEAFRSFVVPPEQVTQPLDGLEEE